jgi:3-hydroxyacyl-[acyl-carrier-protein] dehydratase
MMTTEPAAPVAASISDILKHIPHRYPFILIDRMLAFEPGKWVRVLKTVTANEWYFRGVPHHRRIMPSMLLVESLAQSSGALTHYSGLMANLSKPIIFFAGIDKCKFGRDVRPGDSLILECTLIRALRDVIKVRGLASVDGEAALDLTLMAVVRDMDV